MSEAPHPLKAFQVGNIPTAYYVPNYITEEEEKFLLRNVRNCFAINLSEIGKTIASVDQ